MDSATDTASSIVKATNPWSARREPQSEKEKVYRPVMGILNRLTPKNHNLLAEQILQAGISSGEILQGVVSLIFEKAVMEPAFCVIILAMQCVHLSKELPAFPSEKAGNRPITFMRVLLNLCQEDARRKAIKKLTKPEQAVERDEKETRARLRTLRNVKLIGELFKLKMLPEKIVHICIQALLWQDPKATPAEEKVAEEKVEVLCHLFTIVGKQLEERAKSKMKFDTYIARLMAIGNREDLPFRIRFMVCAFLDTRSNKWMPRREEMKTKKIYEIHAEAEAKLRLRQKMLALRYGALSVRCSLMHGRECLGKAGIPRMPGNAMNKWVPVRGNLDMRSKKWVSLREE